MKDMKSMKGEARRHMPLCQVPSGFHLTLIGKAEASDRPNASGVEPRDHRRGQL